MNNYPTKLNSGEGQVEWQIKIQERRQDFSAVFGLPDGFSQLHSRN